MSLLCDASASSKRALAGSIERFKQDDDYVIELRKESGAVFNHFHHWLYTSHILESGHAMYVQNCLRTLLLFMLDFSILESWMITRNSLFGAD